MADIVFLPSGAGREESMSFLSLNSFAGNECFLSLPFTVVRPTPDNTIALCFVSGWLDSTVRNASPPYKLAGKKKEKEKKEK